MGSQSRINLPVSANRIVYAGYDGA